MITGRCAHACLSAHYNPGSRELEPGGSAWAILVKRKGKEVEGEQEKEGKEGREDEEEAEEEEERRRRVA